MSNTREQVVSANVAIVAATETIVATLTGVYQNIAGAPINLEGWVQVTTVADTTGVAVAVRRGAAITDPLVGEQNNEPITAAAAATESRSIMVQDTPAAGGPYTYILTVLAAGSSTNGSALQSALAATVADPRGN